MNGRMLKINMPDTGLIYRCMSGCVFDFQFMAPITFAPVDSLFEHIANFASKF